MNGIVLNMVMVMLFGSFVALRAAEFPAFLQNVEMFADEKKVHIGFAALETEFDNHTGTVALQLLSQSVKEKRSLQVENIQVVYYKTAAGGRFLLLIGRGSPQVEVENFSGSPVELIETFNQMGCNFVFNPITRNRVRLGADPFTKIRIGSYSGDVFGALVQVLPENYCYLMWWAKKSSEGPIEIEFTGVRG